MVLVSLRSKLPQAFFTVEFDCVLHFRPANSLVRSSTAGEISEASWVVQYIRYLRIAGLRFQLVAQRLDLPCWRVAALQLVVP